MELKTTSDQYRQSHEKSTATAVSSIEKEKASLWEQSMLYAMKADLMAKSKDELHAELEVIGRRGLSATQAKNAKFKYLRLQRKYIMMEGVHGGMKQLPQLKAPAEEGGAARKAYSPEEYGELLGGVLDKLRAGEYPPADLLPFVPMEKFVEEAVVPFRGSRPTKTAAAVLKKKKTMITEMQTRMAKEIKSNKNLVLARLRYTRT